MNPARYLRIHPVKPFQLLFSIAMGALVGFASIKLILHIRVLTIAFFVLNVPLAIVYALIFYLGVFEFGLGTLKQYAPKSIRIWVAACLVSGYSLMFLIPIRLPVPLQNASIYQRFILFLLIGILFAALLLILTVWLVTHRVESRPQVSVHTWTWLVCSAILMLCWLLYLLAYFPGIMTLDSLDQWQQMVNGTYNDWHPIFHTLTNWLITRIWFSPATVAIAQIIALAMVMGWGFSILQRMNVDRRIVYALTIFAGITPGNGMMAITLWKDIFYSVGVVALSLIVLEIVNSQGDWLRTRGRFVFLSMVCASIALYRHNGIFVVLLVFILLLIFYWPLRKYLLFSFLLFGLIFWAVKYPLYNSLRVTNYRHATSTISAINIIAAQLENKTSFTQNERLFLNDIAPLLANEKRWPYNCYANNELFFTDRLDWDFIGNNETAIWLLAGKLTVRSLRPTADYLWCNSAYMFQILKPPHSYYEFGVNTIFPNEFGLKMNSLAPILQKNINILIEKDSLIWILGRAAFWFYLSILALSTFALRYKDPHYLLCLMPSLFSSIPMAFLGGWPAFRYVYPSYLVGILLLGLMFVETPLTQSEPDSSSAH